ncbi:MAG: mucoidy inhibitor MuiA family protein [Candidatus Thorarchaeota archaeon]
MTIELKTRVTDVTVYRDGARVTRSGEAEVPAGEQVVLVPGISRYAQADSFRVKGTGAAVLKEIDVKQRQVVFEPEGDLKGLREELENLERKRSEIADEIQFQESRFNHLSSISGQFSEQFGKWFAAGESDLKRLDEMDKTSFKILKEVKAKLRSLQRELETADAELQTARANIDKVSGQRRVETTNQVKVKLEVSESTKVRLQVVYQLSYAGWAPTYDIDIGDESASVKRIAMIQNQTLEDWEDVALIVSTSTARPVEAVKADPFYIDILQPTRTIASAGLGSGFGIRAEARKAEKDEDGWEGVDDLLEEVEEAPEMEERYADASETLSGTVIYEVPGAATIPSDDESHPITLTEEEFKSKKLHYWNAYAMPEVVAEDEITNGDSVLLPGNTKVYTAGEFLGETYLSLIAPRQKFRLGTRIAYDVKAEKKLVAKDTEKAGITRGKKKRGYSYQLSIKSFAKDPIEIEVKDRIPYSESEKITVELKDASHPPKKQELNILEWEEPVEPNKELLITYSYEVEWEKDVTVYPSLP